MYSIFESVRFGTNVIVYYNSNKVGAEEAVSQIEALGKKAIAISGDFSKKEGVDVQVSGSIYDFVI